MWDNFVDIKHSVIVTPRSMSQLPVVPCLPRTHRRNVQYRHRTSNLITIANSALLKIPAFAFGQVVNLGVAKKLSYSQKGYIF